MKKKLLFTALVTTINAFAHGNKTHETEHKAHIGAHVHGEAKLDIVLDGDELNIMLETPAMNVLAFEYEPTSEEDLETSHHALNQLAAAEWLAIQGGECTLHKADIDWQYADTVHQHFHKEHDHKEHDHKEHDHKEHDHKEHDHKEHDHKEHDHKEHDHKEHDHKEHDHKEHDHKEHDHKEHDHKEHDHKEHDHKEHSDMQLNYEFDCRAAVNVKSITVSIFDDFLGFEKIHVQWIAKHKQGAQTLSKASNTIKFQ